MVLEFSRVWAPLALAYDWYSFNVLPRVGRLVAGNDASYRYLAESIRMHPDQATLKAMMGKRGSTGSKSTILRPAWSPSTWVIASEHDLPVTQGTGEPQ